MNRIKNVSRFFRIIFQSIFIALPIFLILSWCYAPHTLILIDGFVKLNAIPVNYLGMHTYTAHGLHFLPAQGITQKALLHTLSNQEKIIGCLVSFIPTLFNMLIVYFLIQLFYLYEGGEIFTQQHVRYLKKIAWTLLAIQLLIQPLYQFVMGIVLTRNNPPHFRYAAITFDQTNIGIVLAAGVLLLISWIMQEAYKLKQEQQLTI